MVGKLIKHELRAYFRVLVYVGAVALFFAVLTRICFAVDGDEVVGASVITYIFMVLSFFVLFLYAWITGIFRFYQSMFTGEGYMTFSLPVSPSKLLVAKLLSAFIAMLFGLIVFIVACVIVASGFGIEFWVEIERVFGAVFNNIFTYLTSDPLLGVEAILLLIVSIPLSLLYIYTVISIGQLVTNHRKGVTFLILIGATWVVSLLNLLVYSPILSTVAEYSNHLSLWTDIIVKLALDVGMFFFVRFIMLHKLNLIV